MPDHSALRPGTGDSLAGPLPWPAGVAPPEAGTIPGLIDALAIEEPGRAAVVDDDGAATYADLSARSRRASSGLAALGVGPGDAVALLAPNCIEWLVIAVATIRRGASLHAFNTWVRPTELDYLLRAANPKVLVTVDEFANTDFVETVAELVPEVRASGVGGLQSTAYPGLRAIAVLGSQPELPGLLAWSQVLVAGEETPEKDLSDPDDAPVVVYTSGSTRAPKAVPLVQRMMIDNGFAIGERMRLTDVDRVWLASPLFWSYGIANAAMATFSHGGTLVVQRRFEPREAVRTLAREGCTVAYLLPTMVDALCQDVADEVRALTDLRTGLTIGRSDEVRRVVDELGVSGICNVYGLTEVYGNCCVTDCEDPLDLRVASQGAPLPGVQIRVVDPGGGVLPMGEPGEIQVRGRVMPGYLPTPDEEVSSPFTEDGWFRTGDTGLLRADGRIQFIGRHSEMIKTAGINVSPAEIEATLRTCPGVLEAAVVGLADHVRGEVPVAFVVATGSVNAATVVDHCRRLLSSYKVPREVVFVEELPQTATGKLSRKALVELAEAHRE